MKTVLEREQLMLLWGCIWTTQVYMLLRDEEHQIKKKKVFTEKVNFPFDLGITVIIDICSGKYS